MSTGNRREQGREWHMLAPRLRLKKSKSASKVPPKKSQTAENPKGKPFWLENYFSLKIF